MSIGEQLPVLINRRYIEAPWGQIHMADHGAGQPILLVHQTPRSWDEFREVIQALADDHRLVAMDLPGMGASDAHPSGATIEGYAEAAALVVQWLDCGPVPVCGHHTGGVVALQLAVAHPELVSGLILSSTPWVDQTARDERARKSSIDTVTRTPDGGHLQSLWAQRAPHYPAGAKYLDRFIADAMKTVDPAAGHRAVSSFRMEATVGAINCPISIIEHSADPFASRHTNDLTAAFEPVSLDRITTGGVALEATAREFSPILRRIVASSH